MSQPPHPPGADRDAPPHGDDPAARAASPVPEDLPGERGAATVRAPEEPPSADPVAGDDEHNPSLEGLGSRLRSGAKFAAVALVFTQLISLTQTIVIARILTPVEIGTFTLGTLFATFATTVADGGMRAALIQREREVEDAANTAFWVSLVTGTLMSFAALAAAPVLTLYFDDRLVGLVCAATCGTMLVHSLLNVPEALMQRRFNFKRRLIVDPTTASTYAIVAVTFCLLGYGVWGMVIGLYASQVATLVACWALAKWRPGKGTFTFRIWREMARYAAPLVLATLVDQIRDATQAALIGRFLDVGAAGQYRYGRRIGILPGQAIIQVASYVLFPAFARIAVDFERFRDGMLRSLRMLWTATIPFSAVLIALGQPLIVVLLGEQWRPAGLFVAAMAGYGPGVAMGAIGMESIKGAGASKRINYLTALGIVTGIGALVLLLPYGLLGVGLAASIDGVISGLASLLLARNLAGVTIRDLVRVLVPPLIAGTVAGVLVGFLEHFVVHADQRPIVLGFLYLALESALVLGIFLGLLYLMAPDSVRELRDGLLRRGGRGKDGGDDASGSDDGADGGPEGPLPDDQPGFFDAPTEVLPIMTLSDPTQRVYSPYRWPPPARRPMPPGPPPGLPPGRPPVPPAPVAGGIDAPTTALPPTAPPYGAPSNGAAGNGESGGNGHSEQNGNGAPRNGTTANGTSGNGHGGRTPGRRLVPMARVSSRRREEPTQALEGPEGPAPED